MEPDIPKHLGKPPVDCDTMADVRAGVDRIDRDMLALLDERFAYMRAAARIKPTRDAVRDESRKAQVLANVRNDAAARGLPVPEITALWEDLVEASIAYEMAEWERVHSA